MPQVFVYCPETDEPVYTGFNFTWFNLDAVDLGEQSLKCPACGKVHVWTKDDAFLQADGGDG